MSDRDVGNLATLFEGDQAKYFQEAVRTLRSDRTRPLKEALTDFFDACWKASLQQQVKDALDALSRDEKSPAEVL